MASMLSAEMEENFKTFEAQWPKEQVAATTAIAPARRKFVASFVRISSIQAWRVTLLRDVLDEDAEAFFFEAQNDLLISHCLARSGSFRQALKALRSAIDNVLFTLYYKDHAVELRKWELGQHKLSFSELHSYFSGHPVLIGFSGAESGLDALKSEFSTLSKAVHGSAKQFRMTNKLDEICLWDADIASVGMWETREKTVILAMNYLLAHMYREQLTGAQRMGLRQAVGLVVPKTKFAYFKTALKINLIG